MLAVQVSVCEERAEICGVTGPSVASSGMGLACDSLRRRHSTLEADCRLVWLQE